MTCIICPINPPIGSLVTLSQFSGIDCLGCSNRIAWPADEIETIYQGTDMDNGVSRHNFAPRMTIHCPECGMLISVIRVLCGEGYSMPIFQRKAEELVPLVQSEDVYNNCCSHPSRTDVMVRP